MGKNHSIDVHIARQLNDIPIKCYTKLKLMSILFFIIFIFCRDLKGRLTAVSTTPIWHASLQI